MPTKQDGWQAHEGHVDLQEVGAGVGPESRREIPIGWGRGQHGPAREVDAK
jgi:hypothetical protein